VFKKKKEKKKPVKKPKRYKNALPGHKK